MLDFNELSRKLADARISKGIDVATFSRLSGVAKSTIYRYECGSHFSVKLSAQYVKILGLSVAFNVS